MDKQGKGRSDIEDLYRSALVQALSGQASFAQHSPFENRAQNAGQGSGVASAYIANDRNFDPANAQQYANNFPANVQGFRGSPAGQAPVRSMFGW